MIKPIFWQILGLGTAFPTFLIILYNLAIKATVGEKYVVDLRRMGILYFIGLLGTAVFVNSI